MKGEGKREKGKGRRALKNIEFAIGEPSASSKEYRMMKGDWRGAL